MTVRKPKGPGLTDEIQVAFDKAQQGQQVPVAAQQTPSLPDITTEEIEIAYLQHLAEQQTRVLGR